MKRHCPTLERTTTPADNRTIPLTKPRSENCLPPALQKIMPATLSREQLFATLLLQHRFHFF